MDPACHPIIHARGYAMTDGERVPGYQVEKVCKLKEGKVQIPFDSGGRPGISGKVRLVIGAWNH